jgi:hypothetical protein
MSARTLAAGPRRAHRKLEGTDMPSHLMNFCKGYLELAVQVAWLGKAFLIAALALGVFYALAELAQRVASKTQRDGLRGLVTGLDIKTLADALRELIATLAVAPIWLALMAIGLLTFALVGVSVPEQCGPPPKAASVSSKTTAANSAGADRTSNSSVTRGGRTRAVADNRATQD